MKTEAKAVTKRCEAPGWELSCPLCGVRSSSSITMNLGGADQPEENVGLIFHCDECGEDFTELDVLEWLEGAMLWYQIIDRAKVFFKPTDC